MFRRKQHSASPAYVRATRGTPVRSPLPRAGAPVLCPPRARRNKAMARLPTGARDVGGGFVMSHSVHIGSSRDRERDT